MAKILVVDDEKENLKLMEEMISYFGHTVIISDNGEDALKKIKEESPDLVLLDIMMPGIDGFEVTKRVKENEETRIIPIVMITGLTDVESRVKAMEAGADDLLSKPVDMIELKARINSLLKVKAYNDSMKNYQKRLEKEVAQKTKELREALEKLEKTSLDTVYLLSKAAEYKDEETGEHIKRISNYSAAIARRLGLKERFIKSILYASPMHDIGKIGIPDKILLKPGKLTPKEWEIMKRHTIIGAKILKGGEGYLKLARIIALTHHERWDGTGYPKGLKGREIPLSGRIVAVADVFDALISKRPYKEPFSVEKSFEIIKEEKGFHFDPDIVDAFFDIKDEILAIKEKFKDTQESLLIRMIKEEAR